MIINNKTWSDPNTPSIKFSRMATKEHKRAQKGGFRFTAKGASVPRTVLILSGRLEQRADVRRQRQTPGLQRVLGGIPQLVLD